MIADVQCTHTLCHNLLIDYILVPGTTLKLSGFSVFFGNNVSHSMLSGLTLDMVPDRRSLIFM